MPQVSIARPSQKKIFCNIPCSKDTEMTFGDDKYAYQQIRFRKRLQFTNNLKVTQFSIKSMIERDTYKYLGIDKNITYVGPMKKQRIPPNKKDIKFRTVIVQESNSQ